MSHEYDIVWIHPTVCTELFGDTSPEKIKKHEKYRSIIKNIHTDYRELIERGRNSAHTKKMQCNIDLYRFAHFDNGIAKRILFQIVNLENNQQKKRIGLLISAYVARSNNTYDRDIVQLLPKSLQRNNLSQEDVVNCIQLLIDDSIRNDNQEVFFTGYANCLAAEISTKETYASNYAPPGSGKSYMIQESLVRYLRNSKIENVDAEHPHIKKISIPRNTIVLVPGPFLLDAYNQYLKSRIAILDTEPPGDFLENFQDPHKQEHAFLIFGNSKWPYTTSITVLQDFLFEKVEKEGIEPRILICTFEQFFKTLAGEEVYTTNPNYLTEMKTQLAHIYTDATNTDYTLASGYPDEAIQALPLLRDKFPPPNNSKKPGRPKKIDSPTPPEDSKDIMWTVVQKRQQVVQELIRRAKNGSITLRSNVAIKAYKTLQTFISEGKQNNNTFKSVQFIIDEHQDLIPNELHTIFGLLANHPLNEHTSQCKALFFGDNQQRVSNILFSPEILNTIAHHHQLGKIATLDEVYKYSGSYRIHKQMALFASMFTPRAKSDRNYSSFNFSDIPSYNATDGKHPIEMHYVDDVKTFAQTLLQKSTERVVVFSPYVHLAIDNEHVLYLQDWMALKGLEFARLIYISPIPDKPDKDAKNINFDPLENAQLYMAFTRARERILIIQSKKSKDTIQKWLDTNITLKSAELNKNDDLVSLIEKPYTIIDDNNIDISNWTDVIDFAQAFQQFKLLWDEWFTGTIDNFDSVHQVFISMLFAEKNIGFPIWKTERLDIVRNYIHKAYPQWQEKITCNHQEDKKFAFVCLLSTENSMWYQYLEYKYPALCERYKKENSDLIQYAEILRHRIDLGYNMSSDVSDKELVEHVFAQWIEAKFAKKDISSEISIFDDEIITSVYTKLQELQKEINQIKDHHV